MGGRCQTLLRYNVKDASLGLWCHFLKIEKEHSPGLIPHHSFTTNKSSQMMVFCIR